ncbi:hypothetical protein ACIBQ1_41775 [Nonomuraea sp. NPDC050153]|uniref:hypothetical protein n=1 Tax=Nonomuraea sp. NPDC050153 TaxID=3364359 RepID=UPI0037B13056
MSALDDVQDVDGVAGIDGQVRAVAQGVRGQFGVRRRWRAHDDEVQAGGVGGGSILIAVLAVVGFTIINNLISAPMMAAAILSFPSEVRSSAAALNFNVSTSLIGSTTGLVAVWLHDITKSDVTFGWYMTGFCLLSFAIAIFALPTGARRELPVSLLAERK